VNRWTRRW